MSSIDKLISDMRSDPSHDVNEWADAVAAEIERLEAENKELREWISGQGIILNAED
jgi:cell division septum initiation protein DivIVA